MSSKQPLLELEPSVDLRFYGPFVNVTSTELVLTNISSDRVLFKIKTTAPRRYCVRPNSGHIVAGEKAIITIMLQPQDFDPLAERGKHKFMVQSCVAPLDFAGDAAIDQAWKETPPDRIIDTRLKCTFVLEDEIADSGTGKSVKSTLVEQEAGEPRRQPASEARLDSSKSTAATDSSLSTASTTAAGDENKAGGARSAAQDKQFAAENERLRTQLADLQKQHAQLRQSELRLRNVAAQSSMAQATSTQPHTVSQARSSSSLLFAIVIIVALILGMLLGRFIL